MKSVFKISGQMGITSKVVYILEIVTNKKKAWRKIFSTRSGVTKKSTSCLRGWSKGLLVYVAVIVKTADCVNENQSISLKWKRTRPSSRMPNFTVVLNLIYTENLLSLTELEWLLHSKRQRPQRQRPLKLIPAAKITFRKRPVNQRLTPERCIQNLISVL